MTIIPLLGFIVYLSASVWFVTHPDRHTMLRLLVAQYVILLPSAACYLWANRRTGTLPSTRPSRFLRLGLLYPLYGLMILSLVLGVQQGLATGDESSYRFQSRVFLAGRLAAEAPPQTVDDRAAYLEQFRFVHHIIHDGKWFSKYFPGWPALLAVGEFAGFGALVNPVFGLLILWVTFRLARRLFDESIARHACFFLIASPFFLFNCMGFMSHPSCSAFLALATLFCFRGCASGKIRDFAAMALFVGLASLVRPSTAAFAGSVMALTVLWRLRREPVRLAAVAGAGLSVVLMSAAMILSYNHALTGHYSYSTYAMYYGTAKVPELSLPDSVSNFFLTAYRWSLQQTAVYAFVFLFVLAAYALVRERERRPALWVLAGLFAALMVGRIFPPGSVGASYGGRLLFETFFAVAILGAVGWSRLRNDLRLSAAVARNVVVSTIVAQVFLYGYFAVAARKSLTPYVAIRSSIKAMDLDEAIVFMETGTGFSARDFNENEAEWRAAPVFCMPDPGPEFRPVVASTLNRRQWVVIGYDHDAKAARVKERMP